ncbi:ribonuclease P/MRP protein subunit POP5 [Chanos chanos]|uniref:Ribonuclease P/MRP protein subunit POP5 n=1 Tax=Chanos chanos TaxID=29144 RepID=A0A6J2WA43_CHACN|nr:ribonuclease P/MRP protein subunit POP5 [Chanos chanos]
MVRFKSRYLLCELCVSERNSLQLLEERVIYHAVRAAVNRAHGDYGSAVCNIGFSVKYVNAHTGVVLLRCRKGHYRLIWSALPFITGIESRGQRVQCFLNCLHVGGTIRTCQKFLVRYSTRQLHRMLLHCTSEAERREVRKAVMSFSLKKRREDGEEEEEEEEEDDGCGAGVDT